MVLPRLETDQLTRPEKFIKTRNRITELLDEARYQVGVTMDTLPRQDLLARTDRVWHKPERLIVVAKEGALDKARYLVEEYWIYWDTPIRESIQQIVDEDLPQWWVEKFIQRNPCIYCPPGVLAQTNQLLIDDCWGLKPVIQWVMDL